MTTPRDDSLWNALLEYHFGCAEDPVAIEALLERDAAARLIYEEVRRGGDLLRAAAREEVPVLDLAERSVVTRSPARTRAPRRRPARRAWVAASAALFLGLLVLWALFAIDVRQAEREALRVVVSGPGAIPAGTSARFRVETWDHERRPRAGEVSWRVFDDAGRVLASFRESTPGALDFELPRDLREPRRLEVVATVAGLERRVELPLRGGSDAPLVHLSSDKPAYRPGETAFLRATALEARTLEGSPGAFRTRIVDPRGNPVVKRLVPAQDGVLATSWAIPPETAGGNYRFEVRDADDQFAIESLPLLVRAFQAPALATTITLDRETYALGSEGHAEVAVERTKGGLPEGATARATLLVDGETHWTSEEQPLDAQGRTRFAFRQPEACPRGDGVLVVTVTDQNVVETRTEPFRIPVAAVRVEFFPEGGDLVAGQRTRVYFEARDAQERGVDVRGRIVDGEERTVAEVESVHQGRGAFWLEPGVDQGYRLRLEQPAAQDVPLPRVLRTGVTLHVPLPTEPTSGHVSIHVTTPGEGPWIAGVFARGALVAQDAFAGAGAHAFALPLPRGEAGVLRVTVFDRDLRPVAERLVHRAPQRRLQVTIEPSHAERLPGETQELVVRTRDEAGEPVAAVVGLAVSDRGVRDYVGDEPIGLLDHTYLFSELEELEDEHELLGSSREVSERIDLVLGTRGWRRFAWAEPQALLAREGDRARRFVLREGLAAVPAVWDTGDPAFLQRLERAHQREDLAITALIALLAAGLVSFLVSRLMQAGFRPRFAAGHRERVRWAPRFATVAVSASLGIAVGCFVLVARQPGAFEESGSPASARTAREETPRATFAASVPRVATEALPEATRLSIQFDERMGDLLASGNDDAYVWRYYIRDFDVQVAQGAILLDTDLLGRVSSIPTGEGSVNLIYGGAYRGPEDLVYLPSLLAQVPNGEDAYAYGLWELQVAGNTDALGYRVAPSLVYAREFAYRHHGGTERRDLGETLYWNPHLVTDARGEAKVTFQANDRVTTWACRADAHGAGRVGQGEGRFVTALPLEVDAKLPEEISLGDRLEIPVAVHCRDAATMEVSLGVEVTGGLDVDGVAAWTVPLDGGRGRVIVPLVARRTDEVAQIRVRARAGAFADDVTRRAFVRPTGFPRHTARSGVLRDRVQFEVGVPEDPTPGSLEARLSLYPSPLAELQDGLEGLLQQPGGCFEQVSATHYPNTLALGFLQETGRSSPAFERRARDLLASGYTQLANYECADHGFEWYGANPGHETLTAFGLLEFHDMRAVFEVDRELLARTRRWLLERRDGEGGFVVKPGKYAFRGGSQDVANAYIAYALVATGTAADELAAELDHLERRALESADAYEVAVAACALHEGGRLQAADTARERLKTWQERDGSLHGAAVSITNSRGRDLIVETTAFAILAWLHDPEDRAQVRRGVEFLLTQRSGGRFGSTQATIMALKALLAFHRAQRAEPGSRRGNLIVRANGALVANLAYRDEDLAAFHVENLPAFLRPGTNAIAIELDGEGEVPWAFDLRYRAETPADAPDAPLSLALELDAQDVAEGGAVALRIRVANRTDEALPMCVAAIGIPGSLRVPTNVLDELIERERIADWELRGRYVHLYWRGFAPRASEEFAIALTADHPGRTTGPASAIHPYYQPEATSWVAPLHATVRPR